MPISFMDGFHFSRTFGNKTRACGLIVDSPGRLVLSLDIKPETTYVAAVICQQ